MGYGNQKGFTRMYRGTTYAVNLLPKVKVETVVTDDAAEEIISRVVKEIQPAITVTEKSLSMT